MQCGLVTSIHHKYHLKLKKKKKSKAALVKAFPPVTAVRAWKDSEAPGSKSENLLIFSRLTANMPCSLKLKMVPEFFFTLTPAGAFVLHVQMHLAS